ncbi:MAG TPA: 16S rRNA (guanine(966)-N(2))-methyltransferase RsmD [Burkholderiales bacterium]
MRIIGGEWRRRLLEFPDAPDLRPTPDRVRETLFNWLGQDLSGETCLDLFAGSGALGFEAASRGAKHAVLVEHSATVVRTLHANRTMLSAQQVEIVRADAMDFLQADARRYDVVFLDPPFRLDLLPRVLPLLGRILLPGARVYLESDVVPEPVAGFELLKQARAGQVHSLLLKWQRA